MVLLFFLLTTQRRLCFICGNRFVLDPFASVWLGIATEVLEGDGETSR